MEITLVNQALTDVACDVLIVGTIQAEKGMEPRSERPFTKSILRSSIIFMSFCARRV
jgi:hypothetical protein